MKNTLSLTFNPIGYQFENILCPDNFVHRSTQAKFSSKSKFLDAYQSSLIVNRHGHVIALIFSLRM